MWRTEGEWLKDEEGRSLILRGVNLGGDSKIPAVPDGRTSRREGFYDWKGVSFVGRPFPLQEADEHFSRLASWGMSFVRLVFTWEAVEHDGPGIYDDAYLAYLRAICESAAAHGIDLWLDPHQDAWSRWSGGDGAPAWTLTELGFKLENLHASGAAFIHQEEGSSYPAMTWAANYSRLACATLSTLFFGGNEFAPGILMRGEPAQDFLQGRYLRALERVARAVAGLPNVRAFGSMNEPFLGYIGQRDIRRLESWMLRRGPMPTPLEAMAAGEGLETTAALWHVGLTGNRQVGRTSFGSPGFRAWERGVSCLWKGLGLWEERDGRARALDIGHFRTEKDLGEAYLKPFFRKAAQAVRSALPGIPLFVEVPPTHGPALSWGPEDLPAMVEAPHWYDPIPLMTLFPISAVCLDAVKMELSFGPAAVKKSFERQVRRVAGAGGPKPRAVPALIGEFGIPFNLKGRRGSRAGTWRMQEVTLGRQYGAMDAALSGALIWDYSAGNCREEGDLWNREDLSIWSREDGPRALGGFCRPYPARTAGTPLRFSFDPRSGCLDFLYLADPGIGAPTEIFLPECRFPQGTWRAEASFADRAGDQGTGEAAFAPNSPVRAVMRAGTRILEISTGPLRGPRRVRVRVTRLSGPGAR